MYTYVESLEIQKTITQLIGEKVDIFDAIQTYEEMIDDESPLC